MASDYNFFTFKSSVGDAKVPIFGRQKSRGENIFASQWYPQPEAAYDDGDFEKKLKSQQKSKKTDETAEKLKQLNQDYFRGKKLYKIKKNHWSISIENLTEDGNELLVLVNTPRLKPEKVGKPFSLNKMNEVRIDVM